MVGRGMEGAQCELERQNRNLQESSEP